MSSVTATRKGRIVEVKSPYWTVEHDASQGGCITSVVFAHGSGKNLLTGPVSARVRNLEAHPTSDASSPNFFEQKFDQSARVEIETLAESVAVVSSGTLRLKSGDDIGVRYRARVEYRDWGLVACELELASDNERRDIVEVSAFDLPVRAGMTDAYVRENPAVMPGGLTSGGKWFRLGAQGASYSHRYVPMHVVVFERGGEGIEFTAPSDVEGWNTAANSDPGMGYFYVGASWDVAGGTLFSAAPYCVAYRRNPTTLSGSIKLRWCFGLPFLKPKDEVFASWFHASAGSRWLSDAEIEALARSGVKLLRFHNDYREDGPFWHDGMYPPYDPAGMKELRRVVDTAHRCGMKIIPYISVKELHPDTPGCKENQADWRLEQGPTFQEYHTWVGSAEYGQVMCLESGWLDFRKESIEIILKDIPWDGLYFDWETPHACRNPRHLGGRLHSDQDAFYDFMFWVRKRVGPEGVILSHISGLPQIVVENMSTAALIFEDQSYSKPYPEPGEFPPQCEFMPIVPHHLCSGGKAGTPGARKSIMSGILQGHPGILRAVGGMTSEPDAMKICAFSNEFMREMRLFAPEGLDTMKFIRASDCGVCAGPDTKVYGAVWYKSGHALVYLGNFTNKPAKGRFKFDPKLLGLKRSVKSLLIEQITASGKSKPSKASVSTLKSRGLPYSLKRWGSGLYRITAATS